MTPEMLLYRHLLSRPPNALHNYDERAVVRRPILRMDALAFEGRI